MKQPYTLLLLLLSSYSFSQKGSITGNAFWKYNDYVGTRADAGSAVSLYFKDSTKKQLETICDVNGNFKFENLDTGKYLITIVSSNTHPDSFEFLDEAMYSPLKPYFGFDIESLDEKGYADVQAFVKSYDEIEAIDPKSKKERKEKDKRLLELSRGYLPALTALWKKIPLNEKTLNSLFGCANHKIKIEEVTVKANEAASIIADFGLTSY